MKLRTMMALIAIALGAAGCADVAPMAVSPASPASLSVAVGEATLTFDPPEIVSWSAEATAPRNHAAWYEAWDPWPGKGKDRKLNVIWLGPRRDPTRTQILGGLFRSVQTESVVVTSLDGSKTFTMGEDYKYNATWGQIANLNGGLGAEWEAKLKVQCKYALQRLDLIQINAKGVVSVKRGKSVIVCPALPEPDANCSAIAGVYIAPWRQGGKYVVTAENILVINPAPPTKPVNPAAVSRTLAKLRAGQPVTIALMGASITSGAEATRWWDEAQKWTAKDYAYRGRVIHTLRQRFPEATITPVEAYRGGTTTQYGVKQFTEVVAPTKPDLALICFGGNDSSGSVGGKPRNSPERFKELLTGLVATAKQANCEVMLVVTMPRNPWLKSRVNERWPAYRQAMLDIASEQDVAVADVYTEWSNLATRGIPPYSQLHNWINHPGDFGHKVFSDVILRFFE